MYSLGMVRKYDSVKPRLNLKFKETHIKKKYYTYKDARSIYYNFDDLTTSMKYGVYQDFFDKVGLEMVDFKWRNKYTASMYVGDNMKISKQIGKDKGFSKRDDARVFVVNQTNDYYNLNDYKYELESETKK